MSNQNQNFDTVTATITRKSFARTLCASIVDTAALSQYGPDMEDLLETGPISAKIVVLNMHSFSVSCNIERTGVQVTFTYNAFENANECSVSAVAVGWSGDLPEGGRFNAENDQMVIDWLQLYAEESVDQMAASYRDMDRDEILQSA